MTNIIVGDVAQGQVWWGVAEQIKRQLAANHASNNAYMETWKQVDKDTKIYAKMVSGQSIAYIYTGTQGWVYQFLVSQGDPASGYYVAWAEIPMDDLSIWDAIDPNDITTYPKAKLTPTTLSSKFERAALHHEQPTAGINKWVGTTKTGFGAGIMNYDAWHIVDGDSQSINPAYGLYDHALTALPFTDHSQLDNQWLVYYQQHAVAELNGQTITMSPIGLCGIKRADGWHWYYTVTTPLANGSNAGFYWKFSTDATKVCGWSCDRSDLGSGAAANIITRYVEHSFYVDGNGDVQVTPGTVIKTPWYWGSCIALDYIAGTTTLVMLTIESVVKPSVDYTFVASSFYIYQYRRRKGVCLSVKLINVASASVIYATQVGYNYEYYGMLNGYRGKAIAGMDLSRMMMAFVYIDWPENSSVTKTCYDIVNLNDSSYIYQDTRPGGFTNWTTQYILRNTLSQSDFDSRTFADCGWSTPGGAWENAYYDVVERNTSQGDVDPATVTKFLKHGGTYTYWWMNSANGYYNTIITMEKTKLDVYQDQNRTLIALYDRGYGPGNAFHIDKLIRIKTNITTVIDGFHQSVIEKSTQKDLSSINSPVYNTTWKNDYGRNVLNGFASGLVFTRPSGLP